MRPVESTVRPPAVEVERDGDRARVTLRDGFEEVVRDDEGAAWVWQERTCTVPWMDGLDEVVAADFAAWVAHADEEELREREEAEAAASAPDVSALAAVACAYVTNATDITDEQALTLPDVFQTWISGTSYRAGQIVSHSGARWRCLQPHTSQAGWEPGAAPSLWARILPGQSGEVGEWERPGATNGYSKGDRVTHNGKVWESTADANVWEPGDVGAPWVEVG